MFVATFLEHKTRYKYPFVQYFSQHLSPHDHLSTLPFHLTIISIHHPFTMSNPEQGTVKPSPGISSLTNTQWTKPSFTLPAPSLDFLFHLECDMESFRHIGAGPHGDRSTVIFKGGRFEGPKIRGTILPGGGGKSLYTLLDSPSRKKVLVTNATRLGNYPQHHRSRHGRRSTDRSPRHLSLIHI